MVEYREILDEIHELSLRLSLGSTDEPAMLDWSIVLSSDETGSNPVDDRIYTEGRWKRLYTLLQEYSHHGGTYLPAQSSFAEICGSYVRRGIVPIALLDARCASPTSQTVQTIRTSLEQEKHLFDLPLTDTDFTFARKTVAAAIASKEFDVDSQGFPLLPGNPLRIVVPRELFFSDRVDRVRSMLLMGEGINLPIDFGQEVSVSCDPGATKALSLRIEFSDGVCGCAFEIKTRAETALPGVGDLSIEAVVGYDARWDIEKPFWSKGAAFIYYGKEGGAKHQGIKKPLILVEGFPGGGDPDKLYGDANGGDLKLLESLRDSGYDVIIMIFQTHLFVNTIEYCSDLLQECITRTIIARNQQGSSDTLCIVGFSMGGLVARHALVSMESRGSDHQTRLFVSYDSPQQGAVLPIGVIGGFALVSLGMEILMPNLWLQASSTLARQMLIYDPTSVPIPPNGTGVINSSAHKSLMDSLWAMGGYPKRGVWNVAVSNGRGDGVADLGVSSHMLKTDGKEYYFTNFQTSTDPLYNPDAFVEVFKYWWWPRSVYKVDRLYVKGACALSTAPGGSSLFLSTIHNTLVNTGGFRIYRPTSAGGGSEKFNACFMPIASALDIKTAGTDPFVTIPRERNDSSNFHDYIYMRKNTPHCTLTLEVATFLKGYVTQESLTPPPSIQLQRRADYPTCTYKWAREWE